MANYSLQYSNNINNTADKTVIDIDGSISYLAVNEVNDNNISTAARVRIYDVSASNSISGYTFANQIVSPNALRFSSSDNYIAVAYFSTTEILSWDSANESLFSGDTLTQAGNTVNDVSWSPDGNYVAYASDDGNTYVHDVDSANGWPLAQTLSQDTGSHGACEFSYDSTKLVSNQGSTSYLYDTSNWSSNNTSTVPELRHSWEDDDSSIYVDELTDSPETRLRALSGTDLSSEQDYGLTTTTVVDAIHAIPTTDDLVAYGLDSDVSIRDSTDLSVEDGRVTDAGNTIKDARFSDDGSWLATASQDNYYYVYSVSTATFSGTVTDTNSNTIQGAKVIAVNSSDGTITGTDTTASDGTYSIPAPDTTTNHHLFVQYTDGSGNEYNALSKPYVTGASQ